MIAKVCDRESRRDTWFENRLVYLCPRSKPHLQNCLIDLKDFLTQTVQGRTHTKSKIKS